MERKLKGVFMIAIHLERYALRRKYQRNMSEQSLYYSLAVESTSHVIQEVNVLSLLAARVNYSFMHAFIGDKGTGMAYRMEPALGVAAFQQSSQSIRSPSASPPSTVDCPPPLSFERIQSSVLLEGSGELGGLGCAITATGQNCVRPQWQGQFQASVLYEIHGRMVVLDTF